MQAMSEAPPKVQHVVPHEPEIEFLGKVVRIGLWVLRGFFWFAGLAAIAGSTYLVLNPESLMSEPGPVPPLADRIADGLTWWCLGVPLMLPSGWLVGRGRWVMLVAGLALWIGPMLVDGDHRYGFVIRFFASLVAISVLLVWRTVFALTRN